MANYFEILERSEVRFGYRLAVLANWYRGPGYKTVEEQFGLTEPECSALFCVGHAKNLTATDVCHITGRPKNSMSRAIHLLLQKKLLVRVDDKTDGRKKLLALTHEGHALFRKMVPIFLKTEAQILSPLTPSELSDLDKLLTKMTYSITKSHEIY
jgi:MarR family transcriptional regulator, temperature-dependent positive regulator of motility